jgi:hypothetical protein
MEHPGMEAPSTCTSWLSLWIAFARATVLYVLLLSLLVAGPAVADGPAGTAAEASGKLKGLAKLAREGVFEAPYGDPRTIRPEAAKAQAILEYIRKDQVRLVLGKHMKNNPYPKDPEFCNRFLSDFMTQRNIVHVEPEFYADSYDDPRFDKYKQIDPSVDMHRDEVRGGSGIFGGPTYANDNFRLFEVDIDNDPSNGKEIVFYAEEYLLAPLYNNQFQGGYKVYDRSMKQIWVAGTTDPRFIRYGKVWPNFNGIIQYEGRRYVFDMMNYWELRRMNELTLWGYPALFGGTQIICAFDRASQE